MVNSSSAALDATFSALSDPTRRAILSRLAGGQRSVTELAEPFDVSLPAISKHLRVLERAGLVRQEKEGRIRRCRLSAEPLHGANDWLQNYRRFWEERFQRLDALLDEMKREEKRRKRKKEKRDGHMR
ncbi:MAG: ArsR/SmtB family transcription factor [Candidatus Acidiferrales bacterium]